MVLCKSTKQIVESFQLPPSKFKVKRRRTGRDGLFFFCGKIKGVVRYTIWKGVCFYGKIKRNKEKIL